MMDGWIDRLFIYLIQTILIYFLIYLFAYLITYLHTLSNPSQVLISTFIHIFLFLIFEWTPKNRRLLKK